MTVSSPPQTTRGNGQAKLPSAPLVDAVRARARARGVSIADLFGAKAAAKRAFERAGHNPMVGDYRLDMAEPAGHRALAEVLHDCRGTVLLSGYGGELYAELYQDWHRIGRRVLVPTGNGSGRGAKHAMESVWSNRPLAEQLAFATAGAPAAGPELLPLVEAGP